MRWYFKLWHSTKFLKNPNICFDINDENMSYELNFNECDWDDT